MSLSLYMCVSVYGVYMNVHLRAYAPARGALAPTIPRVPNAASESQISAARPGDCERSAAARVEEAAAHQSGRTPDDTRKRCRQTEQGAETHVSTGHLPS